MADMENQPIRFEVVQPTGLVVSEMIDECIIPGAAGYLGVLPGHAPLLTLVGTGEVMYRRGTNRRYLAVAGGFCEVVDNVVSLLAESAERAEDIDIARAERARDRADERVRDMRPTADAEETEKARAALARASARLQVARKRESSN